MSVFDHIISGAIPASFVHQDAHCVAFMDIRPIAHGHVLVVPRLSVATLSELDAALHAHIWDVATQIGQAQRRALGSTAQHLLVNDGRDASQSVPHVHIHVIPRYRGDHVATVARMLWHIAKLPFPPKENPAQRLELEQQAQRIAAEMDS